MSKFIKINVPNYDGEYVKIIFRPFTGGVLDLGIQKIPYYYNSENLYGSYEIYSLNEYVGVIPNVDTSAGSLVVCTQVVTPEVTATPTPTPSPSQFPTSTPTPSPTCDDTVVSIPDCNCTIVPLPPQRSLTSFTYGDITITTEYSGPQTLYEQDGPMNTFFNTCAVTGYPSNTIDLGYNIGPFTYNIYFNRLVNDIKLVTQGGGTGGPLSVDFETFYFQTNNSTPTLIPCGDSCGSIFSGNTYSVTTSGITDPTISGLGGCATFSVKGSLPYTGITITGNGGLDGTRFAICLNPLNPTPGPTLTPTPTPQPTLLPGSCTQCGIVGIPYPQTLVRSTSASVQIIRSGTTSYNGIGVKTYYFGCCTDPFWANPQYNGIDCKNNSTYYNHNIQYPNAILGVGWQNEYLRLTFDQPVNNVKLYINGGGTNYTPNVTKKEMYSISTEFGLPDNLILCDGCNSTINNNQITFSYDTTCGCIPTASQTGGAYLTSCLECQGMAVVEIKNNTPYTTLKINFDGITNSAYYGENLDGVNIFFCVDNLPTLTPQPTPFAICSSPVSIPGISNGIIISEISKSGSTINSSYCSNPSSCSNVTLSSNQLTLGYYRLGSQTDFYYKMGFSQPVNNVYIYIAGAGDVTYKCEEHFIFRTNTGTNIPIITSETSCYSNIVGNRINIGYGAPWFNDCEGGGGGVFKISNSVNFTELSINGAGGCAGSNFNICVIPNNPSITPTPTPSKTSTPTPTPTPTPSFTPLSNTTSTPTPTPTPSKTPNPTPTPTPSNTVFPTPTIGSCACYYIYSDDPNVNLVFKFVSCSNKVTYFPMNGTYTILPICAKVGTVTYDSGTGSYLLYSGNTSCGDSTTPSSSCPILPPPFPTPTPTNVPSNCYCYYVVTYDTNASLSVYGDICDSGDFDLLADISYQYNVNYPIFKACVRENSIYVSGTGIYNVYTNNTICNDNGYPSDSCPDLPTPTPTPSPTINPFGPTSTPTPTPSYTPFSTPISATSTPTPSPSLTPSPTSSSNQPLFDRSTFIGVVSDPYLTLLNQSCTRWETYIKFNSSIYTTIQTNNPGWNGIRLGSYTLYNNSSSNVIASCGVSNFVDIVPGNTGGVKMNTTSFILRINDYWRNRFSTQDWINVLTHELGHALGIGIFWQTGFTNFGAVSPINNFLNGTAYNNAQNAYNGIVGQSRTQIPLEATGGSGTQSVHWENNYRSSTATGSGGVDYYGLINELMIGFYAAGLDSKLSRLSIKTLVDFGYEEVSVGNSEGDPRIDVSLVVGNNVMTMNGDVITMNNMIKLNCDCNHSNIEKLGTIYIDSSNITFVPSSPTPN